MVDGEGRDAWAVERAGLVRPVSPTRAQNKPRPLIALLVRLQRARGAQQRTTQLTTARRTRSRRLRLQLQLAHQQQPIPQSVYAPPPTAYDAESEHKLAQWVAAKRAKDYATADRIRGELERRGIKPEQVRPHVWEPPGKGRARGAHSLAAAAAAPPARPPPPAPLVAPVLAPPPPMMLRTKRRTHGTR